MTLDLLAYSLTEVASDNMCINNLERYSSLQANLGN